MRIEKPTLEEQVIKDQKEKPLPQPMVKMVILACLTVLSMGLFWYSVAGVFDSQLDLSFRLEMILAIALSALAFSLMFAVVGISSVLIDRHLFFLGASIIGGLVHFIFFPVTWANCIAVLSLIVAFIVWKQNIRADLKSRLKFLVGRVILVGVHTAISIVLIAVSFTYYAYLNEDQSSDRFVGGFIDAMVVSANNVLPKYVSYYDPEMTLDEFILESSQSSIEEMSTIPTENIIGDAVREAIDSAQGAVLGQARAQFLDTFGIQANGDEPMGSVVRKIVSSRIDSVVDPYRTFLPAILALSLFFVLKLFTIVLKPLIQFFSFVFYKLLLIVGFVRIAKVVTEKERIELTDA